MKFLFSKILFCQGNFAFTELFLSSILYTSVFKAIVLLCNKVGANQKSFSRHGITAAWWISVLSQDYQNVSNFFYYPSLLDTQNKSVFLWTCLLQPNFGNIAFALNFSTLFPKTWHSTTFGSHLHTVGCVSLSWADYGEPIKHLSHKLDSLWSYPELSAAHCSDSQNVPHEVVLTEHLFNFSFCYFIISWQKRLG